MQIKKYKGIIFDLDGTLVNSVEDIADAMNTVLTNLHFPTHSYDSYQYFIGNGLRSLVQRALPETHRSEEQIENSFQEMIKVYSQICTQKTKAYHGITELLEKLSEQGIKMAVFSNKADQLTKKVVTELFPNYFTHAVGLSIEALKKPNPQEALAISQSWGLSVEEVVFIGDSDIDMQTAINANMFAVGVNWGYRTEIKAAGAAIVFHSPIDILQLIAIN